MSVRLTRERTPASGQVISTHLSTKQSSSAAPSTPFISEAILVHLHATFPVVVREDSDLRTYDRMVGQQAVIAYLQSLCDNQQG